MYFFPMALKTILPIDLAVCGEGGIKKSDYYIQSSGGTKREVGHIQINTNFKYISCFSTVYLLSNDI